MIVGTNVGQTVDRGAGEAKASPGMETPHLILIGYGVTDSLQLTVESQRVLARYGSAYSLGLPARLAAFLKSQRVKVTDVSARLGADTDAAGGYLQVAHFLIERTAFERPVVLLSPGNPLIFNAIGRYLTLEGGRLGLAVQSFQAVSQLDLIIAGIGLDISTFGLQVFDATRLVSRRQPLSPEVPLVLMHVGVLGKSGNDRVSMLDLTRYLARCYPPEHIATVLSLGPGGMTARGTRLDELPRLTELLRPGSHLFIDAIRTLTEGTPA